MKHGWGLALVAAGMLAALGAPGLAQTQTGVATTAGPYGVVGEEALSRLTQLYNDVRSAIWNLSRTFDSLRMATYCGSYEADLYGLETGVGDIALILLGPESPGVDAASYSEWEGYLLGEGGRIEVFTEAFDEYLSLWSSFSDVLVELYAARCVEEHGADGCSAAVGTIQKEGQARFLSTLARRTESLAHAALDALRRVDVDGTATEANEEFVTIYCCAVAAVGYWPMLVGGELPSPDTQPSTLQDLLNLLENVHYDLYDALIDRIFGS